MNKKPFLIIASVLMMVTGVLRGLGGISLFLKGAALETKLPIIANKLQINLVALGLVLVSMLLILTAFNIIREKTKRSWNHALIVIILFLIAGFLNGIFLFGHPVAQGQMINIIVVIICTGLLALGRPALTKQG